MFRFFCPLESWNILFVIFLVRFFPFHNYCLQGTNIVALTYISFASFSCIKSLIMTCKLTDVMLLCSNHIRCIQMDSYLRMHHFQLSNSRRFMMALGPPGDIISIKLRHIIPADARILHGDPLKSNGENHCQPLKVQVMVSPLVRLPSSMRLRLL